MRIFLIETPPDGGTLIIAMVFVCVAYALHPIVESSLNRIRAYRAWRSIQKRKVVEVTHYSSLEEAFGPRGTWDTGRMVALAVALFSVASWGLELSLDLAYRQDGPVDLLNRPPPIVLQKNTSSENGTGWLVQPFEDASIDILDYAGDDDTGSASSLYRVGEEFVEGETLFAWWSTSARTAPASLYYSRSGESSTRVTGTECTTWLRTGPIYLEDKNGEKKWGYVTECESGPSMVDYSSDEDTTPPVVFLKSLLGEEYVIVEEESSYPSFMYSVWKPTSADATSTEFSHLYYVASTVRLAEAMITAIVNDYPNGRASVNELRKYSILHRTYVLGGKTRAAPFGERPGNSTSAVQSLEDVEPIVAGVEVNRLSTSCGTFMFFVGVLGIAASYFLRSRIPMDIFNRDELIRVVSLPNEPLDARKASSVRLFVRQEEAGSINVLIDNKRSKLDLKRLRHLAPAPPPGVDTADNIEEGQSGELEDNGTPALGLVRLGRERAFPRQPPSYVYETDSELSARSPHIAAPIAPRRSSHTSQAGGGRTLTATPTASRRSSHTSQAGGGRTLTATPTASRRSSHTSQAGGGRTLTATPTASRRSSHISHVGGAVALSGTPIPSPSTISSGLGPYGDITFVASLGSEPLCASRSGSPACDYEQHLWKAGILSNFLSEVTETSDSERRYTANLGPSSYDSVQVPATE